MLTDKDLVEKYIGENSYRHDEPFVMSADGDETEIWYLVPYCLEVTREEAVAALGTHYLLSEEEANAAWVWITNNLEWAKALNFRHTDDEEILAGKKVV